MISPIVWVFLVLVIVIIGALMLRKKECKLYKEDGKCVDKCKNKIYDYKSKSCVASCPTGTFEKNVTVQNEQWKVCTECPEGKISYNGTCIDEEKCLSDGKKLRIGRYGITCVDSCDADKDSEIDNNYCFEKSLKPCSSGLYNPITRECCDDKKNFANEFIEIKDKTGKYGIGVRACEL